MSRRAWTAFWAVTILWGIPYALIKFTIDDGISPGFTAWLRAVLGAVTLLWLAPRQAVGVLRQRWTWLALFAAVDIAAPFFLLDIGEQHLPSSLAGTLIATAPLFVAALTRRFEPGDRLGVVQLAGLVIGLAGVGVLLGVHIVGRADELLGALAVLGAAFCFAVGPMLLQAKLKDLDVRASMSASLGFAAVILAPAAATGLPDHMPSIACAAALAALGVLGTAAAQAAYALLVVEAGPSRAIVVNYTSPVVALVLGIAFMSEHPGPGAWMGLPLILAGSYASTARPATPPPGPSGAGDTGVRA